MDNIKDLFPKIGQQIDFYTQFKLWKKDPEVSILCLLYFNLPQKKYAFPPFWFEGHKTFKQPVDNLSNIWLFSYLLLYFLQR